MKLKKIASLALAGIMAVSMLAAPPAATAATAVLPARIPIRILATVPLFLIKLMLLNFMLLPKMMHV